MVPMKTIFKSLLFVTILFALLCAISAAITFGARHSPVVPFAKINKIMSHDIDGEMMIFGASTAWVNFNPEVISQTTNLSVFNMGLDGTPLPEYRGLAYEFIHYSKKCRYVVFAISVGEFSARDAFYQPFKFYAHMGNEKIYKMFFDIQPGFAWRMRYVPFYNLTAYDRLFYQGVEAGWQAATGKTITTYEKDGFFPMHSSWESSQEQKNREAKEMRITIDDTRLTMFRDLASACREKGLVVITVIPPIQQDGRRLIKDFGKMNKTIAGSIPPGSSFLDYSDNELCSDKSCFYNNTHLNYIGADRFSAIFAEDFKDLMTNRKKTGKCLTETGREGK